MKQQNRMFSYFLTSWYWIVQAESRVVPT